MSLAAVAIIMSVATIAHMQVVRALNKELVSGNLKDEALMKARESERRRSELERLRKPDMRSGWIDIATTIRQNPGTDRVRRGLDAIHRAAELDPDAPAKVRLRDEAIEFLALRDVVREPSLETGSARAIAFSGVPSNRESRLAVLSDSGTTFSIWDVASRELVARQDLRVSPSASVSTSGDDVPAETRRGGGPPGDLSERLTSCSGLIAVVRPQKNGFRVFHVMFINDPLSSAIDYTLPGSDVPGRELVGIHLISHEGSKKFLRLVTVESVRDKPRSPSPPRPAAAEDKGLPRPPRTVVRLWDLCEFFKENRTPKPLASMDAGSVDRDVSGPPQRPAISVSPDGLTIAFASRRSGLSSVTILDARTGEAKGAPLEMKDDALISALALGPDGLLAIAEPGTIRLWDLNAGSGPVALPSFSPRQYWARSIGFSHDGGVLAVSGPDPGVELWDVVSSSLIATLQTADHAETFAFSPDGRMIAIPSVRFEAASTRQDDPIDRRGDRPNNMRKISSVSLWSIVNPFGRARLPDSKTHISTLEFGPGDTLAIASRDGPVCLWSPETCPLTTATLDWKDVRPTSLAFDADGRLLTLDPGGLRRVELAPPTPGDHVGRGRFGRAADAPPLSYAFELPAPPDPGWPEAAVRTTQKPQSLPTAVALGSATRRMVLTRIHDVYLVDPDAVETVRHLEPVDRGRGRPNPSFWRSVALAPKGDQIYLMGFFGDLRVWSLVGDRVESAPWGSRLRNITAMALSPDGRILALGDRSGVLSLIDPLTGELLLKVSPADSSAADKIESLAFSRRGSLGRRRFRTCSALSPRLQTEPQLGPPPSRPSRTRHPPRLQPRRPPPCRRRRHRRLRR